MLKTGHFQTLPTKNKAFMLTQRREPCSVDIWSNKVVQNSSRFQIEANKPHVFRAYNFNQQYYGNSIKHAI